MPERAVMWLVVSLTQTALGWSSMENPVIFVYELPLSPCTGAFLRSNRQLPCTPNVPRSACPSVPASNASWHAFIDEQRKPDLTPVRNIL